MDPQGLPTQDIAAVQSGSPGSLLCEANHSQLVVVDIQSKLGAAMPAKVLNRVVQNTTLLLKAANLFNVPVLASEQYPQGLGPLEPSVSEYLPASTKRFAKTCFSCTGADGFLTTIHENRCPQVIITGMEAHVCVLQTAIELRNQGLVVFVAEDAVCSRKLENYQNALIRLYQVGITLISAESVIFEWLKDANHEYFKTLVNLLR
jgi:nicotinamidase-related amidase